MSEATPEFDQELDETVERMRNLYAERQQEPILPGYSYWEIEDSHSLGEVVDEDKDKEEK